MEVNIFQKFNHQRNFDYKIKQKQAQNVHFAYTELLLKIVIVWKPTKPIKIDGFAIFTHSMFRK